jgi:hypothetical protein
MCVCVFTTIPKEKQQQAEWPRAMGTVAGENLISRGGARGVLLSHAL